MSLRVKLTIVVLCVLGLFTGFDLAVQHWVVYPQFVTLEQAKARDDLRRCREAIEREIEHLSVYCHDWSAWDDTCKFIADQNEEYKKANLSSESMASGKRNLDLFVDTNGRVVHRDAYDFDEETALAIDEFDTEQLASDHPLIQHKSSESVIAGIVLTKHGPLLLASRPIVSSKNEGPIRGTLVFGRLLSKIVVSQLIKQTRVAMRITPANQVDSASPAELSSFAALSSPEEAVINEDNDETLLVAGRVDGLDGQPAIWITADVPRDISARGATTLRYSVISHMVTGFFIVALLILALHQIVIHPLRTFTAHASGIAASGDLGRSLELKRSDEIGILASAFDDMVQKLAEYRSKLMESSRKAGMADVASGVLHNVGNVLNSVNVAADLLTENVRKSKVVGLSRAAAMFREHREDLAHFLTNDSRGRQLPGYLEQLSDLLNREQSMFVSDLTDLRTSLDHINQIVQAQHVFAKPVAHEEPSLIADVVVTARSMLEAGLKRHGIAIEFQVSEMPCVLLDRQKLLQILANLLTNAKEALGCTPVEKRCITIRAALSNGRINLQVADSGCGVAEENLTRIFANGFSTKDNGRGFGLHYCALAAQEMGGTLSVHSDGLGRGATFVLDLPFRAVTEAAKA